ncbi:MAG TPA: endonuclease/exonuclease/phosphatase family protein [Candidatus Paceibacterota bacterium]|nr:endonuclease/exonuclease/phosphatase family protein [Candidatus Paceibacterota bacterium]
MRIKIVSLNVWDIPFWFSVKREERINRLGVYLKDIDPDIVCLQEAFDVRHRAVLHEILGKSVYKETEGNGKTRRVFLFKRLDLTGGLVTYSKLPIVKSVFHRFRRFVDMVFFEYIGRKGVLETVIETPKGPLVVMNTHLHTGRLSIDRHVRVKQLKQVFKAAAGVKELPTVILGDFNDNDLLKHRDYTPFFRKYGFEDAALDTKGEVTPTVRLGNRYHSKTWFNRSRTTERLDYALVRNFEKAGMKIAEYRNLEQPANPLSDHDPVMITIE